MNFTGKPIISVRRLGHRVVEYNPTSPMEHRGVSAALEVGAKLGLAALLNLRGRAWNY